LNLEELREIIYEDYLEDFFEERPEKESVSHSPYLMQKFDESIGRLPLELREKIYKDYVSMMQKERAALGWNKVHEVILKKSSCNCSQYRFGGCTVCRDISRLLQTSEDLDEMIDCCTRQST